jgi:hypothetical protein
MAVPSVAAHKLALRTLATAHYGLSGPSSSQP